MDKDSDLATGSSSGLDEEWTKVEFSERERNPYSFAASSTENKEPVGPSPGAFPADEPSEASGSASGNAYSRKPSGTPSGATGSSASQARPAPASNTDGSSRPPPRPRMCRICLDVVYPTMEPAAMPSIPGLAPRLPRFVYTDPELGRLLSPCKCKGSSRYVHEECLKQWRLSSPAQDRNYWHCPTCKYAYRLERLTWANYVQSVPSQIVLTLLVFVVAMFAMGFVADPIINIYLDPWSLFGWGWSGAGPLEPLEQIFDDDDERGWFEHFFKGMAGLGVLGFIKVWLASPFSWFYSRAARGGGGRVSGRDRMESLNMAVILIGVATALWAIYTAVRAFSRKTLARTAEKVLDVGDDDDE